MSEKICRKYWCIFERVNHRLNGKKYLVMQDSVTTLKVTSDAMRRQQQVIQTLKKEMVNFRTVVKLQKS